MSTHESPALSSLVGLREAAAGGSPSVVEHPATAPARPAAPPRPTAARKPTAAPSASSTPVPSTPVPSSVPRPRGTEGSGFRPDIQGLRAIAVITVVLYHAGVPWLRGGFVGVDLFFVISGFLITSLLLRERLTKGRISLPNFWARRVRRLLPVSCAVLVVTSIGSIVLLPRSARVSVGWDIASAATSVANWRFAWLSTDYLAQGRDTSPVLHYWSLGVEEQFYLVWPLVIALITMGVVLGGRSSRTVRIRLLVVLSIIAVSSFVYGLITTHDSQPYAFFGTPSRAWQLAAGALVAVSAPRIARIPGLPRAVLGWAGLLLLLGSVVLVTESGAGGLAYPGWVALLPTIAGMALVAAGIGGAVRGLGGALGTRPMRFVGDLSYSWYLWHWPLLVFVGVQVEGNPAWARAGAVILSFVLAVLSYRLIETPWRYPRPVLRRAKVSLLVGVALTCVSLVGAGAVVLSEKLQPPATVTTATGESVVLRPDPAVAVDDVISLRDAGCDLNFEESDYRECVFGPEGATKRVVLFGDSHAVHVFPGMLEAAQAQSWRLQPLTKSACPVADVTSWNSPHRKAFTECDTWRANAVAAMIANPPSLVVISASFRDDVAVVDRASGEQVRGDAMVDLWTKGLHRTMRRLSEAGIPVLILRDVPASPENVPACVETSPSPTDCAVVQPQRSVERAAAAGMKGVHYADFTPLFCAQGSCAATVGDVLVYRDEAHITKTFAETLKGFFETTLSPLLS